MKNFLVLLSLLLASLTSSATHVAGGNFEINYIGPNQYQVVIYLYRSCESGASAMPTSLEFGVYEQGTNNQVINQTILNPVVSANLPFGDVCYTPISLCVDQGVFTSTTFMLPDYGPGYFLQLQYYARNHTILNISNPGSTNMTLYAEIPDPALGQNSSPQFGTYPMDAYFCAGSTKYFDFGVFDPDGDSLSYELVDPLDGSTSNQSGNGTFPPPYPSVNWNTAAGYSLANIINGSNPMSVNPLNGVISATCPNTIGKFAFALKVSEWRNGIKIGEVTRDIQYESQTCDVVLPPEFVIDDSLSVYVNDSICFDINVYIPGNTTVDTLYLQIYSSDFDLQTNYIPPVVGSSQSTYSNWMNSGNTITFDNLFLTNNMIGPGSAIAGVEEIPLRYCWVPECGDLDSLFHLNLIGLVLDTCYGTDTTTLLGDTIPISFVEENLVISVDNNPPPTLLNVPDTIVLTLGDEMCIDLLAEDSININDTLFLQPYSGNFDFISTFVPPNDAGGGSYYYQDFITPGNTLTMSNYTYSGFTPGAVGQVGLRFCWTTDCDYVFQEEFDLNYMAFSTACGSDTIFENSHIEVDPPIGFVEPLPNVFTPNGDGVNDNFKLKGIPDPCYDFMAVTIFNRWGQKVFESEDSSFEWDGTHKGKGDCKAGTYYVLIDGSFGSTYDPNSGERVPNLVKDEYYIQLLR